MKPYQRLTLTAASALLLMGTGCGSDAVKGLSRGGTAETANFRIQLPHTLYQAEEPESIIWDYSFLDRSGYMISVQDFDFGYAPEDFLGGEYQTGEAAYENGTLGDYDYCGWIAEEGTDSVLKYVIGTQGRLLYAMASVPENKQERAKKQIFAMLENAEYIGKPIAPGSASVGFLTVDYPETWAEDANDSSSAILMLHPAVNHNGSSITFSVLDDVDKSPKELAENALAVSTEGMTDFYSETALLQKKLFGYDAYIARLRYGEPEDENGCTYQDSVYFETPAGICYAMMIYCDPGAEEYLAAVDTLTLTVNTGNGD